MSDLVQVRKECSIGEECPGVARRKGGGVEVTGELPDGTEATVLVPDAVLPEVGNMIVDNLGEYIAARHTSDLLRVQTRDYYGVASDDDDFRRYLAGASVPEAAGKQAWLDKLAADAAQGKVRRNVHIVRGPVTDYLRYMFEWGYTYNVRAGQDIRILEAGDSPAWARLMKTGDYNIIEGKHGVRLRYDSDGTYQGAVQVSADAVEGFAVAAELAWSQATPFTEWWAAHPQYHRTSRAA